MKRVMIIGCSGSGKSSLALKLGEKTGLPVVHMDQLYWQPKWVMRSDEAISELVADAISRDTWIFDGNYSRNFNERAARSDTIIFLDIPRWLCLFRVTKRALSQLGKSRSDMADDCPERIDGAFWEFLKFIYNYPANGRLRALKLLEEAPENAAVFHLRTRSDVDQFLHSV